MIDEVSNIIFLVMENSELDSSSYNITPESNLREDLDLDSLALAELTVRIEEEFGIDIFEDGLVDTVEEVLEKLSNDR